MITRETPAISITIGQSMVQVELESDKSHHLTLRSDYGTYGSTSWKTVELQMYARTASNYSSLIFVVDVGSAIAGALNRELANRSRLSPDEAEQKADRLLDETLAAFRSRFLADAS